VEHGEHGKLSDERSVLSLFVFFDSLGAGGERCKLVVQGEILLNVFHVVTGYGLLLLL